MKAFIKTTLIGLFALWASASFAQTDLEISGAVSWQTINSGSSVRIEMAQVRNRSQTQTSGTVHIILRATTTPDIVGSGHTLADINLANYADDTGRLGPGEGWSNISISVPFTAPPDGTYYTHLAVVEYPNLTTVLDHVTMNGTTTFGQGPQPPPGDDHGDSFSSATVVSLNSNLGGRLEANGDLDVFQVTVSSSGMLSLSTSGATDTVGTLYNASQVMIAQDDDSGSGVNFGFEASVVAGTYYIVVSGYDNVTTGDYALSVGFAADDPFPPPTIDDGDDDGGGDGGGGGFGLIGLALLGVAAWRRRKQR